MKLLLELPRSLTQLHLQQMRIVYKTPLGLRRRSSNDRPRCCVLGRLTDAPNQFNKWAATCHLPKLQSLLLLPHSCGLDLLLPCGVAAPLPVFRILDGLL